MTIHLPGALRMAASALSSAIMPAPPVSFAQWIQRNIELVDGPKKGDLWSPVDAPYLLEIAECLDVDHPSNLVTVRKSQQTGVSILALAWCIYIAEMHPDNVLYGVPSIDMLQDINSQKLQPLIDAWQARTGKDVILPVTGRSGRNSTTYEKRFPGGYISLANANTVLDLSGKTCRYGVKDEMSKWGELPNGADPEALYLGRFTAYRRTRQFKIFELSTPETDSGDELGDDPAHCRIDRSFKRSDQRYWFVACVECGHEFALGDDLLHLDRRQPHKSVLVCPDCGHWITETERVSMVRSGAYRATRAEPDRHPGFHVDAFISLMMSIGDIASDKIESEARGESGAKDYANLVCGLPYQIRGNAPDWQRLMERREGYAPEIIPPHGLIFTAGADVQHNGIYFEAVAFAEDRQSWTVYATFLPGGTDNIYDGAWPALDALYRRIWLDANGNDRRIDALAVDAGDGGRMTQVLEWCRERSDCYAIKGDHGRAKPPLGLPSKASIRRSGSRQRIGSALLWPVGTWGLKSDFYGNLHKRGLAAGEASDPPGYCHFHGELGEEYFRQITAEYFDRKMVKGRLHEEWKTIRRDNHFLDCRIYAMAMAEHMGLTKLQPSAWAALRARYAAKGASPTLFDPAPIQVAAPSIAPDHAETKSAGLSAKDKWKRRT